MPSKLKHLAIVAIAASLPGLAFAQTAAQPTTPSTMPPSTTTTTTKPSSPAPMPQATVPAPLRGSGMAAKPNVDPQARRASRVIGANIVNEENRTVGEVHDLLISPVGSSVTAVLSVGGFLGIGEHYVAIPLSDLQWNAAHSRWMLPGATVESLKATPAFTYPERS